MNSIQRGGTNTGGKYVNSGGQLPTTPIVIPLGTINQQSVQTARNPLLGAHFKYEEYKENGLPQDKESTCCQKQPTPEQVFHDGSVEITKRDSRPKGLPKSSSIVLQEVRSQMPDKPPSLAGDGKEKSLGDAHEETTTKQEMAQTIANLLHKVCSKPRLTLILQHSQSRFRISAHFLSLENKVLLFVKCISRIIFHTIFPYAYDSLGADAEPTQGICSNP